MSPDDEGMSPDDEGAAEHAAGTDDALADGSAGGSTDGSTGGSADGSAGESGGGSAGESGGGSAGESPADPVVRRFAPDDEVAVRRLYGRAMRDAGTDPADVPGTTDLDRIEAAYLETGGEFLVVEVEGEVVAIGGLVVDGEDGDEAELLRVAVDPARQREGYGSLILDGLEAAARDRGVERVVLSTARRQAAATEFYPARGYDRTGRERFDEYEILHFEKDLSG